MVTFSVSFFSGYDENVLIHNSQTTHGGNRNTSPAREPNFHSCRPLFSVCIYLIRTVDRVAVLEPRHKCIEINATCQILMGNRTGPIGIRFVWTSRYRSMSESGRDPAHEPASAVQRHLCHSRMHGEVSSFQKLFCLRQQSRELAFELGDPNYLSFSDWVAARRVAFVTVTNLVSGNSDRFLQTMNAATMETIARAEPNSSIT